MHHFERKVEAVAVSVVSFIFMRWKTSLATASFRRGSAQRRATIDLAEFPTMERIIHRRGLSTPSRSDVVPTDFTNEHRPLMAASDSSGSTSGSTSPTPLARGTRPRRRDALKDLFARLCRWKWTILALAVINLAVATFIGRNITKRDGDESLSLWPKDRHSSLQRRRRRLRVDQYEGRHGAIHVRSGRLEHAARTTIQSWRRRTPSVGIGAERLAIFRSSSQRWLLNFCDELKSDAMSQSRVIATMVVLDARLTQWLKKRRHSETARPTGYPSRETRSKTPFAPSSPHQSVRHLTLSALSRGMRPTSTERRAVRAFSAVAIKPSPGDCHRRRTSSANTNFQDAWLREKIRDTAPRRDARCVSIQRYVGRRDTVTS